MWFEPKSADRRSRTGETPVPTMFATPPPEGLKYSKLDIPRSKGRVLDTDGNCVAVALRDDLAVMPFDSSIGGNSSPTASASATSPTSAHPSTSASVSNSSSDARGGGSVLHTWCRGVNDFALRPRGGAAAGDGGRGAGSLLAAGCDDGVVRLWRFPAAHVSWEAGGGGDDDGGDDGGGGHQGSKGGSMRVPFVTLDYGGDGGGGVGGGGRGGGGVCKVQKICFEDYEHAPGGAEGGGRCLAAAGSDRVVRVWDIAAGRSSGEFTVDGGRGSGGGAGHGNPPCRMHEDAVQSLHFSPRDPGILLTSSKDKHLRVIDVRQGTTVMEGLQAHGSIRGTTAIFAPHSGGAITHLITTGFSKLGVRQIGLWDPRVGLERPLTVQSMSHPDPGNGGLLHPMFHNDKLFLAGPGDTNIRFYNILGVFPYIRYMNEYCDHARIPQLGTALVPPSASSSSASSSSSSSTVILRAAANGQVEPVRFRTTKIHYIFSVAKYLY